MHYLAFSLASGSSTLGFVPQKSDTYGRPAASDLTHNQSMLALRHIWKFQRAVVLFLYPQWRWEKMTYLPQKWAEKQTNKKTLFSSQSGMPPVLGNTLQRQEGLEFWLGFRKLKHSVFPLHFLDLRTCLWDELVEAVCMAEELWCSW